MVVRIIRQTASRIGMPVTGVIITSDILSASDGLVSLSETTSLTMFSASAYLDEAMPTARLWPVPSL